MSMELPQDVVEQALSEHDFDEVDKCKRCGKTKEQVLNYWRRGLADAARCRKKTTEYQGSRFKHMTDGKTGITLGAISPEARQLLDRLVEKFEETHDKSIHDADGYTALYWACRWSGLIRPMESEEG